MYAPQKSGKEGVPADEKKEIDGRNTTGAANSNDSHHHPIRDGKVVVGRVGYPTIKHWQLHYLKKHIKADWYDIPAQAYQRTTKGETAPEGLDTMGGSAQPLDECRENSVILDIGARTRNRLSCFLEHKAQAKAYGGALAASSNLRYGEMDSNHDLRIGSPDSHSHET